MSSTELPYDAILILSFGGPEKRDDVIPFLENVLRGKPVPRERLLEVAEHYYHFDGISPINQQCRDLIAALRQELTEHRITLPIYWGNRNWHPMLGDTIRQMKADGIQKALMWVTSAYSSYSGCRQYRENVLDALREQQLTDLQVDKIRVFYNHPDFVAVIADKVAQSLSVLDSPGTKVAFTAHSIPMSMARTSDYVRQLQETCRLVAERLKLPEDRWNLVYQSRSGRPEDPWLEPDILDFLKEQHQKGMRSVVICPVGFLSDHMEVLYDLDDAARHVCEELGIRMERSATPGHAPSFIRMIRKLIQERLSQAPRECCGQYGPNHDVCPVDCCPAPRMRPASTERPA